MALFSGSLCRAAEPEIYIRSRDCVHPDELVLVEVIVLNAQAKDVRVSLTFPKEGGLTSADMRPDREVDDLYWVFIPQTPGQRGLKSGEIHYKVSVAGVTAEGSMRIDKDCAGHQKLTGEQRRTMEQVQQRQLPAEQAAEVAAASSRRKWLLAGGVAGAAALGLALQSDSTPLEPQDGSLELRLSATSANGLTFDLAAGNADRISRDETIPEGQSTFSFPIPISFCIANSGVSLSDTTLTINLAATLNNFSGFSLTGVSAADDLTNRSDLLNNGDFAISFTADSITITLSADYVREVLFNPAEFTCPILITLELTGQVERL